MERQRVRMRFRKEGDLRLISHRDLLTAIERLFRRIGLKLSMSGGFHPRPRISFPLSLALGIRGLDEVFEVEIDDPVDGESLLAQLQAAAPPGLVFTAADWIAAGSPRLAVEAATYEIDIPPEHVPGLHERVAAFLAEPSHVISRDHRDQTVDVRSAVTELTLTDSALRMRLLTDSAAAAAKPQEVLQAIGLDRLLDEGCYLTRTALILAPT
jgi:radical SAM-linked protein